VRWIRYSLNNETNYGLLDENDRVTKINGSPLTEYELSTEKYQLSDLKLEVPIIPKTFYCVGLNYIAHIGAEGLSIPTRPEIGYRANNALIAHQEEVLMPADATAIQYEGELVVVIGKTVKNISRQEASQCIFGYTMGNDVSERNWQKQDRTFWRSKNSDTFKPMGPWIATDVALGEMQTTVAVNDVITTQFNTADMLFGIDEFISETSRYITLHAGDVIWMGTDGNSPNLQHNDRVDISLTGLGTLSNRFIKMTAE